MLIEKKMVTFNVFQYTSMAEEADRREEEQTKYSCDGGSKTTRILFFFGNPGCLNQFTRTTTNPRAH
jgi:hypothetical protein